MVNICSFSGFTDADVGIDLIKTIDIQSSTTVGFEYGY